jgi:hypothetical protein
MVPKHRIEVLRCHSLTAHQRSRGVCEKQLDTGELGEDVKARWVITSITNFRSVVFGNPFTNALAIWRCKGLQLGELIFVIRAAGSWRAVLFPSKLGELPEFDNLASPFEVNRQRRRAPRIFQILSNQEVDPRRCKRSAAPFPGVECQKFSRRKAPSYALPDCAFDITP